MLVFENDTSFINGVSYAKVSGNKLFVTSASGQHSIEYSYPSSQSARFAFNRLAEALHSDTKIFKLSKF